MMMTLVAVWMGIALGSAAMSNSRVRKETRFLTDKMAYELNLTSAQYNDVYEINFDFINGIRYIMDDAMMGYEWALDRYYDCLDLRNDDLRWVLSRSQYLRFMDRTYFCRPVYATGNGWGFRIYITYTNHSHFYYPKPAIYHTYCGGHLHTGPHRVSYYQGRYDHPHYMAKPQPRQEARHNARRSDFGRVNVRPGTKQSDRRTPPSSANSSKESRKEPKREAGRESRRVTNTENRRETQSVRPTESRSNSSSTSSSSSSSSSSNNNRSSSRSSSRRSAERR